MRISERLLAIISALPLKPGIRILEIGCGPGVAAREIARRLKHGHVLGIDRSEKAIRQAIGGSEEEIRTGKLSYRQVTIENFELKSGEDFYDIAFAVRVGALDGRHPEIEHLALAKVAKALTKSGKLFIDGGNPLKEVSLDRYR